MNEDKSKSYNKKAIVVCLIAFLAFLVWIIDTAKSSKLQQTIPPVRATNQPQIHASASLRKSIYTKGEKLTIDMIANTQGKSLSGFDVVLHFDPSIVRFEQVSSPLPSFDVYTTKKTGVVSVTGSLKIDVPVSSIKDNSLFSMVFTPLKNGNPQFSIDYTPGKRSDSNLIDDKSQDILKIVSVDDFFVGSSLKLSRGKSVSVGEGLEVTLQSATVADSHCADCTNDAVVAFNNGGKTHIVKYVEGGIDGQIGRSDRIGNFLIQLESIQDGYIMVGVYKAK